MSKSNAIGLDEKVTKQLVSKLNGLLSNFQVFYMNVRGFHWNIKGEEFFTLHPQYEQLYTDLQLKIDEIAERIRTLGETPLHSFSSYLKQARIKEQTDISAGPKGVQFIVDSLAILVVQERSIIEVADKAADSGTSDMMTVYIREQEKLLWMYSAYLKK